MKSMIPQPLRLPVFLSVVAAVVTTGVKATAYGLTGSVGLFSDAVESCINILTALMVYISLRYAARPVDTSHTYGHQKIEYFASGLEGGMILVASGSIAWAAVNRLLHPRPLEPLALGLGLSILAAGINLTMGLLLVHTGRKHGSIVVEADGQHVLTDVWTSGGVVLGLMLASWTSLPVLDPVVALLVAANIVWTAVSLLRRSFDGLMDRALPDSEVELVRQAIVRLLGPEMDHHALRTRKAGTHRFLDFHLLVPGRTTVAEAHSLVERIEAAIRQELASVEITIHVEPIEEGRSWQDSALLPLEEAARRRRGEQSVWGPRRQGDHSGEETTH